jgi:hypothetical protein
MNDKWGFDWWHSSLLLRRFELGFLLLPSGTAQWVAQGLSGGRGGGTGGEMRESKGGWGVL